MAGEEDDAVADVDLRGIVRGQHHGDAAVREPAHDTQHLRRGRGVEPGRRLVEEEDPGAGQQLDRDARSLALPAGEVADGDVAPVRQLEVAKRVVDDAVDLVSCVPAGRRSLAA